MSSNFHQQRFAKGQKIVTQGEVGDRTYVIRTGNVLVCREDDKGEMIPIKELGPGDMFGEMYLYNSETVRTATVVAVNEVVVDVLFDEIYRKEMEKLSPFQKKMIQGLTERLNETTDNYLNKVQPLKPNPEPERQGQKRNVFDGARLSEKQE